jgi:hypothetical protein
MALGTTSALLLAAGTTSAGMSVAGGMAQAKSSKNQAAYTAEVYEQQAEMIKEQKKIQNIQFLRQSAAARGSIVARTAGKGMLLSGSPLAILIDTESQMQFDKAIADYNLDINKNFAKSAANNARISGAADARLARFTGFSNAFSTMLNTGASLGSLNLKPGQGAKV